MDAVATFLLSCSQVLPVLLVFLLDELASLALSLTRDSASCPLCSTFSCSSLQCPSEIFRSLDFLYCSIIFGIIPMNLFPQAVDMSNSSICPYRAMLLKLCMRPSQLWRAVNLGKWDHVVGCHVGKSTF